MPQFRYSARGAGGAPTSGTLAAQDQKDALAQLRRQGVTPLSLEEEGKVKKPSGGLFQSKKDPKPRLKGDDLSESLSLYPKVFPPIYATMVKAGEASGKLDEILQRLAEYQESTAAIKREVKSAMMYPAISMFLILGITVFLMLYVVPIFKKLFDSLHADLPAPTNP